MVTKALFIFKIVYLEYSLLFVFHNATSHSIYTNDTFCIIKKDKKSGKKQIQLYNRWYKRDKICIK